MTGTVIIIAIMVAWLAVAALIGWLLRPKDESDPMMRVHGDVPGRGR